MPAEIQRREGSARLAERARKRGAGDKNLYPGLNDLSDALEAMPMDIVRHFTLLKEIEAKCVNTTQLLSRLTVEFLEMPPDPATVQERESRLAELRAQMRELMPCLEERMHVAGLAAEAVKRHTSRLDYDFDLITKNEIPEDVQFDWGHDAIKGDKAAETKSTTRSESRREAMAAKKAAAAAAAASNGTESGRGEGRGGAGSGSGRNGTPGPGAGGGSGGGSGRSGAQAASSSSRSSGRPTRAGGAQNSASSKRRRADDDDGYEETDSPVSRPGTPNGASAAASRRRQKKGKEEVYCYCERGSFGDMVGCDGADCKREWFHLPCVGLTTVPQGQWFCKECAAKLKREGR